MFSIEDAEDGILSEAAALLSPKCDLLSARLRRREINGDRCLYELDSLRLTYWIEILDLGSASPLFSCRVARKTFLESVPVATMHLAAHGEGLSVVDALETVNRAVSPLRWVAQR